MIAWIICIVHIGVDIQLADASRVVCLHLYIGFDAPDQRLGFAAIARQKSQKWALNCVNAKFGSVQYSVTFGSFNIPAHWRQTGPTLW
jgi:hypothetical protein